MQETPHVRSSRKATPRFLGGRKHRVPSYVASDGQIKRNVFCRKRIVAKLLMPPPAHAGREAAKPLGSHQQKKGSILRLIPSGGDTLPQCKLLFQQDLPQQRNPFCSAFKSDDVWRDAVPPGTLLCWRRPSGRSPDPGSPSPGSEQVQPKTAAASAGRRRLVHR